MANNRHIGEQDIRNMQFRQLNDVEVDTILVLAEFQASVTGDSPEEWRRRLATQALRQVDGNAYMRYQEDPEARAVLEGVAGSGRDAEWVTTGSGDQQQLFRSAGEEFTDSNINRRDANRDGDTRNLYEDAGLGDHLAYNFSDVGGGNSLNTSLMPNNADVDPLAGVSSREQFFNNCPTCTESDYSQQVESNAAARQEYHALDAAEGEKQPTEIDTLIVETRQPYADVQAALGEMGEGADIVAQIINPAYGAYVTVEEVSGLWNAHGDDIIQTIQENPELAAAAGITAGCVAVTACRNAATATLGRGWDAVTGTGSRTANAGRRTDVPPGGVDAEVGHSNLSTNPTGIATRADNPDGPNPMDAAGGEGDFYARVDHSNIQVIPNHSFVSLETSSGVTIQARDDITTTVLGTYGDDMGGIINTQLNMPTDMNFTSGNPGGFNVLNVPNRMYDDLGPDRFWDEVNVPFLNSVIDRGDDIYLATRPSGTALLNPRNSDGLSGFGREYKYLTERGYVYDPASGRMCYGGCK